MFFKEEAFIFSRIDKHLKLYQLALNWLILSICWGDKYVKHGRKILFDES